MRFPAIFIIVTVALLTEIAIVWILFQMTP